MSVSLAAKLGSRERLKVRRRCGCSLCARQMRCTEPTEMPIALAIARPVQWVAWCGGAVHVNATTCAVVSAAIGAFPGLRVLSRNRPSTPLSAKRCCHRHTVGRLTPMLCAHPLRRMPIRRGEHDARPLDMFARPVAVSRNRRQPLALCSAQYHTHLLCHGRPPTPCPSIVYPAAFVNPLNDSEH